MFLIRLALKSLRNRLLPSLLTVGSIALSVALLVGIEHVRTGVRESFTNTISGTDLIVGARGGGYQLLLYSVFGIGAPAAQVSAATYAHWAAHPAVAWTVPYSLGDSHRGFRVIGTNDAFYAHYRTRGGRPVALARGRPAQRVLEAVLGAEVAADLGYELGERIVLAHGMGATSLLEHGGKPFAVVGVLERTATPVDRAVYVTLEGVEALHVDWDEGAPPRPGEALTAAEIAAGPDLRVDAISCFFVGTSSRREVLRLQREIDTYAAEPLTAIIPAVVLGQMWRGIGYAENALRLVTLCVVVVGLLGMLVAVYTSLEPRRREMAVLRSIGAHPWTIVALLVLESGCLATAGAALGVVLVYAGLLAGQTLVESWLGIVVPLRALGTLELAYLGAVVVAGFALGAVPAAKAYRTALHDGLSVRL